MLLSPRVARSSSPSLCPRSSSSAVNGTRTMCHIVIPV
ncbi:hypothetical protein GFS60_00459 [Rhodococcus sp. WAY2]|nr:hypothetical protein GFS60_00459 [Rhodococcus sp. WAY2]